MQKQYSKHENISLAVRRGLSSLVIEEPLSGSEYADKNFYLSPESSSIKGPWKSLPYQVGILDFMGSDDIQVLNFKKCARVGYTKMLVADKVYKIVGKKRKCVVFQPTDTDAKEFVADEIDPALRDCKVFRDELRGKPERRGKFNKNDRKEFRNGSVFYIRGGKSGTNYRRLTVDQADYDELAGFDHNVDNEGSPLILGDKRFKTSPFKKSIRGTTPKLKGRSLIDEEFDNSDIKLKRFLLCPHCGDFYHLNKSVFDVDKPETVTDYNFYCQSCGAKIEYSDYPDSDAGGRWGDDSGNYYDEDEKVFISHSGDRMPTPLVVGVEIWEAYSYYTSWRELFSEWNRAVSYLEKSGDDTKIQTFVNTSMGEAYEQIGTRLSRDTMSDRLEEYSEKIPNDILYITMAIDVQQGSGGQQSRIECEIVGWGEGEESWSLDYLIIPGDPEQVELWDRVDNERTRLFTREDGVVMRISRVGIDCGYLPNSVLGYTKPRQGQGVVALKGDGAQGKQFVGSYTLMGPNKDAKCYVLGTNHGKDIVFRRLAFEQHGPGFCHFPARYGQKYFDGLMFSEQKIRDKKDPSKFKYEKIHQKGYNEPLDCRYYNLALIKIASPNWEMLRRRSQRQAESIISGIPVKNGGRGRVINEGVKV